MNGHDGGYEGGNMASWLLDDLGIEQDLLKINCDNMSAIYLAKKTSVSCKNEAH